MLVRIYKQVIKNLLHTRYTQRNRSGQSVDLNI